MKKIFILLIAFCMLMPFNTNAGANTKDITPKNEISDVRKSKKIKTIQKLLSTKIGKWIIKKNIKKHQKQALNPQKNKGDGIFNLVTGIFILGALFLLGGIAFVIGGGTLVGVIFIIIGLLILGTLAFFISLLGNAFRHN